MNRKERVAKRRAERAAQVERPEITASAPKLEAALEKPAPINYPVEDLSASGVHSSVEAKRKAMPTMQAQAEVQNPSGLIVPVAGLVPENPLPRLNPITPSSGMADGIIERGQPLAKAPVKTTAQTGEKNTGNEIPAATPSGSSDVNPEDTLPKSMAEIFASMKKDIEKEKTDAAKMQKYYALADVFQALGKMGGAAVGGAIGGNVLDSAPNVGEYKESRGYLNAFEDAKKANERLRNLQDKEYQLALRNEERQYNRQLLEDDRKYKAQQAEIEREYQAEQKALDREWQKTLLDYKAKIEQANLEKNYELKAKYEKELTELQNNFKLKYQQIANDANYKLKELGLTISQQQQQAYRPNRQIAFDNGTGIEVTPAQYKGLQDYFINKMIGNVRVTKDNFTSFLRENPQLVSQYLSLFGGSPVTTSSTTPASAPSATTASVTAETPSFNDGGWLDLSLDTYDEYAAKRSQNYVSTDGSLSAEDTRNKYSSYRD